MKMRCKKICWGISSSQLPLICVDAQTQRHARIYIIFVMFSVVPLLLLLLLLSTQNKIRFNWIYRLSIESLLWRERTVLFIKIRCSWQSVAIYIYIYKHTIYARCVQDVDTMSGKFIKLWHEILRCLCVSVGRVSRYKGRNQNLFEGSRKLFQLFSNWTLRENVFALFMPQLVHEITKLNKVVHNFWRCTSNKLRIRRSLVRA